jgi:hypothetical protein
MLQSWTLTQTLVVIFDKDRNPNLRRKLPLCFPLWVPWSKTINNLQHLSCGQFCRTKQLNSQFRNPRNWTLKKSHFLLPPENFIPKLPRTLSPSIHLRTLLENRLNFTIMRSWWMFGEDEEHKKTLTLFVYKSWKMISLKKTVFFWDVCLLY